MAKEDTARDLFVTVGENVRFHNQSFANNSLDGVPAAIDLRPNPLNHGTLSPIRR
jgi:hypothetical protein